MYHIKMAFTLIQVGTNLWINPMQLQGIHANTVINTDCMTILSIASSSGYQCSDWPIDRVREALSPTAVSRAMESK